MEDTAYRAIAIVGTGAVLPDAPNVPAFWDNIKNGRYSISEVTPDRWDPAMYYDPDHAAPDKSYSKIGGWVREHTWEPAKWRLAIPPRVVEGMDEGQKWAISCTREALQDYGYPDRPLDLNRVAVILGNAMAGEKHYLTALRIYFPEYAHELEESATFAALPEAVRRDIRREMHQRIANRLPEINEDTMPGELSNCIAGRVANLFNLRGPNYVVDAACASAMAAMSSAVEGLIEHDFDLAITGGIDRNMGASSFIKFCKIGALSATGTRPYADGADGFVMGEGAAVFLMKRLADAERDGDKIYAVLRAISGSSDGKGKGITAPNPIGQKLAIERAWKSAGLSPATVSLIEGHGTSTRVGDVVEVESMSEVLRNADTPIGSVALGSVKSNIGHLKAGAGAAGFLKATLALRDRVLPPSLHCDHRNPAIDFDHSPVRVNTELRPWTMENGNVRRAGLSAFGFGGTNFHAVLEEYIPHRLNGNGKKSVTVADVPQAAKTPVAKTPLRGALVIGADSEPALINRLREVKKEAEAGRAPAPTAPAESDLRAPERVAIDYADAAELAVKSGKALNALEAKRPAMWKALGAQGIFRGRGPASKVAFLYTGQGSQYVNMLRSLRSVEPLVAETFVEADRVLTPLLGKPLSDYIFVDPKDKDAIAKAEEDLRQTAITQPAVLATDVALTKLLGAYGVSPDMTMGHSLGEYGALVGAGAFPFADALEAVSARGREMTRVSMGDNGKMAAVFAPIEEVEKILKSIDGYVVIANINALRQAVIGGASDAVDKAVEIFQKAGHHVVGLQVSHAFHTSIVAPASEPLRRMLERLHLESPRVPVVSNVTGEFYPSGPGVLPQMLDLLGRQIASPVQFVKGLNTCYNAGARVFVEVGPKRALEGFVDQVLGERGDVISLFTNHPKTGDAASFNQALCGLYAAGLGAGVKAVEPVPVRAVPSAPVKAEVRPQPISAPAAAPVPLSPGSASPLASTSAPSAVTTSSPTAPAPLFAGAASPLASTSAPSAVTTSSPTAPAPLSADRYSELGRMFADVLERGMQIYREGSGNGGGSRPAPTSPVAITGAALGLPGTERIFDDSNVARILRGEQLIDVIPSKFRRAILDKNITRLVKNDNGGAVFETITGLGDVIKLAGRGGAFDPENEFGIPAERLAALDRYTQLAIAVGLDAMRDAGIPLVMRYKTTSKGTLLPDRWGLPDTLRDDTGIIFASAFPGLDSFADELTRYHQDHARREEIASLESLRARITGTNGTTSIAQEIDRRIAELRAAIEKNPYVFDRRFLFRILSMGHSQFAEFIGARGPNTAVNAACASTTQAVSLAEDWIRAGRCRRVIVVASDDITSDHLLDWMGAGFLATGAAATDEVVEEAALPFDRRRHGMLVGMGAAGIVVESAEAARERGVQPICEVLSAVTANSAFHGTRLDIQHISNVMEQLVAQAESRTGFNRKQAAEHMVFVSHETYTPARGGSASAEIHALRQVFGDVADKIVIANTKGFTGHAMGAGIEDVVAVKTLETGCVPPVANFKEIDPELGALNLSKGGSYPVEYALRLGAGFGSQISMTLYRWVKAKDGVRPSPNALGYASRIANESAWSNWLGQMTGQPAAELEVVRRTLRVKDGKMRVAPVAAPPVVAKVTAPPVVAPAAVPVPAPAPKAAAPVTPPPMAAAPPSPATPAAPAAPAKNPIEAKVLEIVASKTGYPIEMLALDLDLEADLGVDTVKQAEVFAAVREAYGIERDPNLKLRDFPTLAHVMQFVRDRIPALSVATPPPAQASAAPVPAIPSPAPAKNQIEAKVLEIVASKTGYPIEMLALDLDLEADLGVDTVKQAEVFAAVREAWGIERDPNLKLRDFPTLAHVMQFVRDRIPAEKPVAAAAPVAAPVAPAAPAKNQIEAKVLEIVASKTGYPVEMLDLDLDLEADLGVDTVKQAEVFASVREAYGIERDPNLKLRDFPTLAHVIQFVRDRMPASAAVTPPVSAPAAPVPATPSPAPAENQIEAKVLEIVAAKTGYPIEMLDLDLDLEADLGVDTVKQAEVFASVREAWGIERDPNLKLRDFPTLAHVIQFVRDRMPAPSADTPPASAPAAPVPATAPAENQIEAKVLEIVAAKTGYPVEMLDLDLDLEADLGVDTVKQAEVFASVREAWGIERDPNLKLRDFPTLAHVIQFVRDRMPAPSADTPPAPAPAAPVPATPAEDQIEAKVLEIVAAKTGYPVEMLDLDLDLEADLGVDTVKQAEVFASVREAFGIERDPNLKLRDFPTLSHVIQFARERAGKAPAAPAAEPTPAPAATAPVVASLDAANSIPRRVPVPQPRPALTICKPTGVTLGQGSRVVLMPDQTGVADALTAQLQPSGVEVLRIDNPANTLPLIEGWLTAGPIQGVYWLPALDPEQSIAEMDLPAWHEAMRVRVKALYTTMRALFEQTPFLVSAVRLGGQHGYDPAGAVMPLGGAVTGFTKTYKRERADAIVKAVDFEPQFEAAAMAGILIEETLRDPGAVEIGYQGGQRWTVGLQEQPAIDGQPGLTLDKNSVFVVTGAAGSIVSAIVGDLASASGGTFYLLDLAPAPDPNNTDIDRFITDKDGLKRDLFARIQARGERATPAMVERELAGLERVHAARTAIQAVTASGGTAHYFSVNLTDANAVAAVIDQVRERSGHIDVLLHAAGMERSHFLPDKEPREFDLVFDVKADGWFNLLHAIGDMPLGATVAFSSIAGRFGNGGQTDYSSANDLLCKISSSFRTTRPGTRGIAIDWTAWGGIGMATRGSIPKMMELAGIDMLPPDAGIPLIRRELTAGGTRGEIVVAQRLGILMNEFDATGGIDPGALTIEKPMTGKVTSVGLHSGLTVETTIDPTAQAFLYDHQIDGTPVLPGVMGVEAFAEAALSVLPGWHVEAIEDVSFQAPFKLYRNEPRTVTVNVVFHPQGDGLLAECKLTGSRTLPNQPEPQITTHFTGRVRLTQQTPEAPHTTAPSAEVPAAECVNAADIYKVYFHGPAYQVMERVWADGDRIVGEMPAAMPANHQPSEQPLAMAPRLIELCFQTAGLWEMSAQSRMGLPNHIDRVSVYRSPEQAEGRIYAVVTPHDNSFDAEVVDTAGNKYVQLTGYRTVSLPNSVNAEPFKVLLHAVTA